MRALWTGRSRLIIGVVMWIALIVAVLVNWEDVRQRLVPAGYLFPFSVILMILALLGGALGWAALQPEDAKRRSLVAFMASQPAKYLPGGGAFQALGQVGLSASAEAERSAVGWAFLTHAGVQALAATSLPVLLLLDAGADRWLKTMVVVLGVVGVVALRPSVIDWISRSLVRLVPRLRTSHSIPNSPTLWRSWGWTLSALALSGAAFVTLLGQWSDAQAGLTALGAFSLAWLVGFVIFPLPSGLGAREVVLVALLPHLPSAQVLGISVIHRFASILAESIVLLVVSRTAFARDKKRET